jgi:hypothetical protein
MLDFPRIIDYGIGLNHWEKRNAVVRANEPKLIYSDVLPF